MIIAEVIRRTDQLPADPAVVKNAIDQMRNEFLPIADRDGVRLARIAATHKISLAQPEQLPDLARLLDTHLVLSYRNGHEWSDVHPLIREVVIAQAKAAAAAAPAVPQGT
jgi:hypothetical protein